MTYEDLSAGQVRRSLQLRDAMRCLEETYGDAEKTVKRLCKENERLRNLVRDVYALHWSGLDCTECPKSFRSLCNTSGGCPWLGTLHRLMDELGIEVSE